MSTVEKWYYLGESNAPSGPLSTQVLAERLEKGELTKETLCWCDGRETWQCAEDIAEIQAALGAALATSARTKKEKNEASVFDKVMNEMKDERFVDDDGTLYVWNRELGKYEPQPMEAYNQEQMTFEGDDEKIPSMDDAIQNVKEEQAEKKRKTEAPAEEHWSDPKKTTSIYVTGLPLDATVEEMAGVFSKCGVLKEDDDGVRIKIYRDKGTGMAKGDGLVTYMKRPSVDLAMNILGGTSFREGMMQTMTIQEAKFELKGERKAAKKTKQKKTKKSGREDRLFGWAGFDDHLSARKITVVLKHMFHPQGFSNGELTVEELKQDVRSECEKLGEVDRVTVYHEHEEGVVSVRFRTEEAAEQCIAKMNGRYFAQRQIQAHKWDGFTKYHHHQKNKKSDEDEDVRLEKFAQELEKGEGVQS